MADLVGENNLSGFIVDPDMVEGGLRSKQFATVIDLLGYGEIDSILDVGGSGTDTFRKNIFLNQNYIHFLLDLQFHPYCMELLLLNYHYLSKFHVNNLNF